MTKIMLDSALQNLSGPLGEFMQKLSGPSGNTEWLPAFKRFLRKENPWDGKPLFAPWKTVRVESAFNNAELVRELKGSGYTVTKAAVKLLMEAELSSVRSFEVEFIRVTPKDLGLENGAEHYLDVLRRLKFYGLSPCEPEEVAALRRHCDEQAFVPMSEGYLEALMQPILVDGELKALELNHDEDGQLKLTAFGIGDNVPGHSSPYVCVLRRFGHPKYDQ